MHIIHGTWIPDDTHEFIQKGAFYLWVETDTPAGTSRSRASSVHPRHLAQTALATFLMEKLGLREPVPGALARTLHTKYFLLPTVADKPAPSFELLRYVEEEEPIEFALLPWQICCSGRSVRDRNANTAGTHTGVSLPSHVPRIHGWRRSGSNRRNGKPSRSY